MLFKFSKKIIKNKFKYFCSKSNNDFCFNIKKFLEKEEKKLQVKNLNFKDELKFNFIHLGNLNFDLIKHKIKISNDMIDHNSKIKKNDKEIYLNFNYLHIKKTNNMTIYKIEYMDFIKERNIFYILFTILVGKVVKVSIIYVFEGKILNYFIFYEIYIHNFFNFMNRILNEIKVFELYLYDQNSIIPKAVIQSINIIILKKIDDKLSIKYI
jgi:hypothetical protein